MRDYGHDGRHWAMHDAMGSGWFALDVVMILVLVLLGVVVFLLVRGGGGAQAGTGAPTGTPSAALQTLDDRLARGEIDVAEYTARRDALRGS